MEENYKGLYVQWNQEGILKDNLIVISMLVKANITEKQICKFYKFQNDLTEEQIKAFQLAEINYADGI